MEKREWKAFGDVNPIEHGGIWIREDSDCKGSFYIVKWSPVDDEFGMYSTGYVTPTDEWIEKESVFNYADLDDDSPIERIAIGVFEYYSPEEFGGDTEYTYNNELMANLIAEGIEV